MEFVPRKTSYIGDFFSLRNDGRRARERLKIGVQRQGVLVLCRESFAQCHLDYQPSFLWVSHSRPEEHSRL